MTQHENDDRLRPDRVDQDEAEHLKEKQRTDTVPTEHGAENADDDVSSDPALDDRDGSDWSDEGGATAQGPATAVDDD